MTTAQQIADQYRTPEQQCGFSFPREISWNSRTVQAGVAFLALSASFFTGCVFMGQINSNSPIIPAANITAEDWALLGVMPDPTSPRPFTCETLESIAGDVAKVRDQFALLKLHFVEAGNETHPGTICGSSADLEPLKVRDETKEKARSELESFSPIDIRVNASEYENFYPQLREWSNRENRLHFQESLSQLFRLGIAAGFDIFDWRALILFEDGSIGLKAIPETVKKGYVRGMLRFAAHYLPASYIPTLVEGKLSAAEILLGKNGLPILDRVTRIAQRMWETVSPTDKVYWQDYDWTHYHGDRGKVICYLDHLNNNYPLRGEDEVWQIGDEFWELRHIDYLPQGIIHPASNHPCEPQKIGLPSYIEEATALQILARGIRFPHIVGKREGNGQKGYMVW